MPATTDTVLTFDGQEEPNMLKFEVEQNTDMHSIQTIGIAERVESLPGKTRVNIHIWVNGFSQLLDGLHMAQGPQPGFQVVITVSYSDGTKGISSYDDCDIIQKTVKGEAQMPTITYYKIQSTRERLTTG
jgi:hypothetical protein